MPVAVVCPNPACARTSTLPDDLAGQPVRCRACGRTFTPAAAAGSGDAARAAATVVPAATMSDGHTIGRFVVRGRLGAGAFGTVYKAFDPQLQREVALKVPNAGVLDSPRRVERFLRE